MTDEITRSAEHHIKELEDENQRLLAAIEGIVDRETLLRWLHVQDGAMDLGLTPPQYVMRVLAELFAFALDDVPNFQTSHLTVKSQGYEMTIRKVGGKTPAQLLHEMRPVVEAARKWWHDDTENIKTASALAEAVDVYESATATPSGEDQSE